MLLVFFCLVEAEKDLVFVSFDTSVLPEGTEYGEQVSFVESFLYVRGRGDF